MTSFFLRRQRSLKIAATVYVLALMVSHARLDSTHVWLIAAFFSVAMNFTYLIEACSLKRSVRVETVVAAVLIAASLAGVLVAPVLVILAIFAHGIWDLAKHYGSGVPFFAWYVVSCFLVDSVYGAALLLYWRA